ncbi:cobalt-precorrin 5A hydrolase [Bengtsoniella intestinalis]|uniref:cobalt-precorrin 5A hydrolase n=1 Tax=Bengtsoniella intestinalis TaxID=3073143 RepID=UPI00391EE530
MTTAIIAFTAKGALLGRKLADGLEGTTLHVPPRLADDLGEAPYSRLEKWVGTHWEEADYLIFVGATGIAVRAIAPHVKDKFLDPAVLSLDEQGRFVISLLSGHVGGGNELAVQVASIVGGQAVISTATDVNGLFAVDVWAKKQGLVIGDRTMAKVVSATLLEGNPVGFATDCGVDCPVGLTEKQEPIGIWVSAKPGASPFPQTLPLLPKSLTLGIGCRRDTSKEAIVQAVKEALGDWDLRGVFQVASIDLKAKEPGLLAFCEELDVKFMTFTAEQLQAVPGDFTPSAFVASVTGVDNVCERAAVLAGGTLVRSKWAKNGVTVAVAERMIP